MNRVNARTTEDGSSVCNNRIHTIGTAGHSDKCSDIEEHKFYPVGEIIIDELGESIKHSRLKELLLELGLRLNTDMVLLWNIQKVTDAELAEGTSQKRPSFIGAEVKIGKHLIRVITSGNTTRYGIFENKKWHYKRNFETIKRMI